MMRSWTRRNGSNPLGSLSLHPRCGKIRADVNRQIIQNSPYGRGRSAFEILFGSGSAGLGRGRKESRVYEESACKELADVLLWCPPEHIRLLSLRPRRADGCHAVPALGRDR